LCISPINNDKINPIEPNASVWSIELYIIEGSIEHPIYYSALVWSIELHEYCIISCLCISLINYYKINIIDRDPIKWLIELDTIKGLIEHQIDTNALVRSL